MNIRDVLQKIENNAFWGSLKNCTLLPGRLAKEIAVLENAMFKGEKLYACPSLRIMQNGQRRF